MIRSKDPIVGTTIGFLKVITRKPDRTRGAPNTRARVLCQCICGSRKIYTRYYLVRKKNPLQHCGCKDPIAISTKYKVEYTTWTHMIRRCTVKTHVSYTEYGGRGIRVCERWTEGYRESPGTICQGFHNFLADLGKRPSNIHSLDRIDPNGAYEPKNCRWATITEQARNKRGTKYLVHPRTGLRVAAAQLAEEAGMSYHAFRQKMITEGKW